MSRIIRPRLTIAATVLALGGFLVQAPLSAVAGPSPAVIGTLVSPSGQRLGGVTIKASVEPTAQQMIALPAGAEVKTVPVGSAVTSSSGAFQLRISNFTPLKKATDDESLVSIILEAATPKGQLLYRVRLVFTAGNHLRVYRPDLDSDLDVPEAARSRIIGTAGDHAPVLALVTTQVTPTQAASPAALTSASSKGEVDPPRTDRPVYHPPTKAITAQDDYNPDQWCGGYTWYLKKSKDVTKRHVGLMDQSTGSRTTGSFTFETTKATSMEVGITNEDNKLATTLGMAKGSTASASIESPIGKSTKAEWYIGYDFNIYDFMCQSAVTGDKWWSGYSEYRPKEFNGDVGKRSWTVFKCKQKYESTITTGSKVTISKDRTATKSSAFSLGGSGMKASQTWGSTQTVQYQAIGDKSYGLCGKTDYYWKSQTRTKQT